MSTHSLPDGWSRQLYAQPCMHFSSFSPGRWKTPKMPSMAGMEIPLNISTICQGLRAHSHWVQSSNPSPRTYPGHRPRPTSPRGLEALPSQPGSMEVKHSDCDCGGSVVGSVCTTIVTITVPRRLQHLRVHVCILGTQHRPAASVQQPPAESLPMS
jgi:hypothetical protein